MPQTNILNQLREVVINGDDESAKKFAIEALEVGIDPLVAIKDGLTEGMEVIGRQFRDQEIYLPQVVMAADAMKVALEILEPRLSEDKRSERKVGTVVIGTGFGDIHDIGKNILAALLRAAGVEIHDLGNDVSNADFMNKAKEVNADAICMSALLTASMIYQKDLVKYLDDARERDKFLIIVGGGAVSPQWATKIKADGYGKLAEDGIQVLKRLVSERKMRMDQEMKRPLLIEGGEEKQ